MESPQAAILPTVNPLFCFAWGCSSDFTATPTPRSFDVSDDRLSAVMDMDVFDRHFLLPFAAMLAKGVEKRAAAQFECTPPHPGPRIKACPVLDTGSGAGSLPEGGAPVLAGGKDISNQPLPISHPHFNNSQLNTRMLAFWTEFVWLYSGAAWAVDKPHARREYLAWSGVCPWPFFFWRRRQMTPQLDS